VTLRRPRDFEALQREGAVRADPLLVVRARRTDLDVTRIGLSIGRRVGGAVVRNRTRRRMRAVLRSLAPDVRVGWDILLIARPSIASADQRALTAAIVRVLHRSGVLADGATA
jgi:ribonuclease P protein component